MPAGISSRSGIADGLARLANQPQAVAVEDDDADGAGMDDELALDLLPVLVTEATALHVEELAFVDGLGADALEAGAHATAASSSSVNATSSIDSSAATDTRSVGSWLCSVPLATLTQGIPAASKMFASDAPPVAMRRGS